MYGAFYSMGIGDEWDSYKIKGTEMLTHYHTFDKQTKDFDEIVDYVTEERSFVTILDPDTGDPLEGEPLLSGQVDMVYRHKRRGLWIRDHKALSSPPVESCLGIDDQLTGYCYIYWRLSDEMVRGAEYNVLLKDPPHAPKLLVSGKLSVDKAQRTTLEMYRQAIRENHLKASDYEEMLSFLRDKGWGQFFIRSSSERNIEQLAAFERKLAAEVHDMQRALADPDTWAYPNQSQYVCPGCPVMPICKAMDEGSNVDSVIENGFETQEKRTTIPEGV